MGTPKGWRVYIGGNGGTNPRIADLLAEQLPTEDALALVERLFDYYRANAKPRERMGRMVERLGLETLKDALGLGSNSPMAANESA